MLHLPWPDNVIMSAKQRKLEFLKVSIFSWYFYKQKTALVDLLFLMGLEKHYNMFLELSMLAFCSHGMFSSFLNELQNEDLFSTIGDDL